MNTRSNIGSVVSGRVLRTGGSYSVMVRVLPLGIDPRLHGYDVAHAPEFDTNTRPAGVGSVTVAPVAVAGP